MQTLQTTATTLLQSLPLEPKTHAFAFLAQAEPCFLLLLTFDDVQSTLVTTASELLTIALAEQACMSVQGLSAVSLWTMASQAVCASPCHVYLNLDLLTIDTNTQDWGDFKIKPEQVEVQRNELTHAALFNPRLGFVVQVLKTALPTFMEMLRAAGLAQTSAAIGKTWGEVLVGEAVLDIYRDAKKQVSFSTQTLLALKSSALQNKAA
jgi:hypothetical protein